MAILHTLIVGGDRLEGVVRGRETAIGRMLSVVSKIDPWRVAYGFLPSLKQRQWDREILGASALPTFQITYWTGSEVTFQCPERIWRAAKAAARRHGCDPLLVVAIAHSEGPTYNSFAVSPSGAEGTWQFMSGTWDMYWPPGSESWSYWPTWPVQPSRSSDPAAADAGCRMELALEFEEQTSSYSFSQRFLAADGGLQWNDHPPQALYVWRLWQKLLMETGGVDAKITE